MVAVIVGEQLAGSLPLLLGIEGTPRQTRNVNVRAGDVPVNLLHRDVIRSPGFDPAIEAIHDQFVGVVGIAWRQRLETMQGVQIAQRPGNQRRGGADRLPGRPPRRSARGRGSAPVRRLRSSSQSRYPPIAASRIPPSGRNRIAAPTASPHPSQTKTGPDQA